MKTAQTSNYLTTDGAIQFLLTNNEPIFAEKLKNLCFENVLASLKDSLSDERPTRNREIITGYNELLLFSSARTEIVSVSRSSDLENFEEMLIKAYSYRKPSVLKIIKLAMEVSRDDEKKLISNEYKEILGKIESIKAKPLILAFFICVLAIIASSYWLYMGNPLTNYFWLFGFLGIPLLLKTGSISFFTYE